jgi:hypothetical protein
VYSDPAKQPADAKMPRDTVFSNLHSAGHAYLDTDEGTLLAHGGESDGSRQSFLFHGATNQWEITDPTEDGRFYASSLTLADGKILTFFGTPLSTGHGYRIEVYNPATGKWQKPPIDIPATFDYLYYPWTYLLPGGDLFSAGNADHVVPGAPPGAGPSVSRRYSWTAPVDDPAKRWLGKKGNRSIFSQSGTSVLLSLRPPAYAPRILMMGGNTADAQQTAEVIDLSAPTPDWTLVPDLKVPRPEQVNSVLLPDGRVFLAGGVAGSNAGTAGPSEIFDPENVAAGWTLGPTMKHARGYHSSAILLLDGSVLMGGDPRAAGKPTPHERYFPGYYFKPRPAIAGAPATTTHGATFTVDTPNAASIIEAVLLRPGAVTHGFNQSQRFVGCEITAVHATSIDVKAPPDGNIAPPGWYLLFLVDASRVPSVAKWIRLSP